MLFRATKGRRRSRRPSRRPRPGNLPRVPFTTYLQDLESQRRDSGGVAFFDLDRTLIAGYSVAVLGWEGFKCAIVPRWRIARQLRVFFHYGLGLAHYLDLVRVTTKDLTGMPESEFLQLGRQAFRRELRGRIYDEGRRLVAAHHALGHTVVLITSATRPQAEPCARELGIGHLRCTELETVDGRLTGAFEPCYGFSKRDVAERFCEARGLRLNEAWFYTDGIEDLPLLEAVGRPVTANPKAKLAALARERGWPHLKFLPPGQRGEEADNWRGYLRRFCGNGQRFLVDVSQKGKAAMARLRSR